jgi:hypothetical protein
MVMPRRPAEFRFNRKRIERDMTDVYGRVRTADLVSDSEDEKEEDDSNGKNDNEALAPREEDCYDQVYWYAPRWCRTCQNWKAPRSHHCSVTGKCVMRMDHFCPFTGAVIGLRNQGHLLLMFFFAMVGLTGGLVVFCLPVLSDAWRASLRNENPESALKWNARTGGIVEVEGRNSGSSNANGDSNASGLGSTGGSNSDGESEPAFAPPVLIHNILYWPWTPADTATFHEWRMKTSYCRDKWYGGNSYRKSSSDSSSSSSGGEDSRTKFGHMIVTDIDKAEEETLRVNKNEFQFENAEQNVDESSENTDESDSGSFFSTVTSYLVSGYIPQTVVAVSSVAMNAPTMGFDITLNTACYGGIYATNPRMFLAFVFESLPNLTYVFMGEKYLKSNRETETHCSCA